MNREELIDIGLGLKNIKDIEVLIKEFEKWKQTILKQTDSEKRSEYKIVLHVSDSDFESKEQRRNKYVKAVDKTINILKSDSAFVNKNSENTDILVSVIQNFNIFMQNMFMFEPDKKATLKGECLKQIKINNEYDLQHIMYAVLKTVYPNARREVTQDIGSGFNRYDIVVDDINTVVEIKCTRKDHTDKKLLRELGEDAFFYKCDNLVIYVYDKNGIIKDIDNFVRALEKTKKETGKNIIVKVEQEKELL